MNSQSNSKIEITNIDSPDGIKVGKKVTFFGHLDESNVDDLSRTIYALIEEYPDKLHLLFDFENLTYMNSKSIGYLTDWYTIVNDKEGKIVIAKAAINILDTLKAVGITKYVQCFDSMAEAKSNLF